MKDLMTLQRALKPDIVKGVSTGGAHAPNSGARIAATDGLARPFKPLVATPVTLPGLPKQGGRK